MGGTHPLRTYPCQCVSSAPQPPTLTHPDALLRLRTNRAPTGTVCFIGRARFQRSRQVDAAGMGYGPVGEGSAGIGSLGSLARVVRRVVRHQRRDPVVPHLRDQARSVPLDVDGAVRDLPDRPGAGVDVRRADVGRARAQAGDGAGRVALGRRLAGDDGRGRQRGAAVRRTLPARRGVRASCSSWPAPGCRSSVRPTRCGRRAWSGC